MHQLTEDVLHLALLGLELAPVLVEVLAVLAAQQDILPFLNLDLEFDVGRIDQSAGFKRTVEQAPIGLHTAGEKAEAGQCGDQDQHQAAAEQSEDLRAQGFLQKHGRRLYGGCDPDTRKSVGLTDIPIPGT